MNGGEITYLKGKRAQLNGLTAIRDLASSLVKAETISLFIIARFEAADFEACKKNRELSSR